MSIRKKGLAACLGLTLMLLLTACGGRPAPVPQAAAPSLAEVRRQALAALDVNLSSQQREEAREGAMTTLLALLRTPTSTGVATAEWEQPFAADSGAKLSYLESGKIRVYGLSVPASGIVPPGERVAVQFLGAGAPQAYEVPTMQGGQVITAQATNDDGLILAYRLVRGGGYVAYYQRDTKTGEFKAEPSAFRGVPPTMGDLRLEVRGDFLVVDVPVNQAWTPQFDKSKAGRLFLTADVGLEWKGRFEVIDERSYTAFQGFQTATSATVSQQEREEAWDKATRKLPAYLQQVESLTDTLAGKLPPGAEVLFTQSGTLWARVISIPAPTGLKVEAYTVVQHRVGNGMPMAQAVSVPGVVESFQVVNHEGHPGLILLSGTDRQAKTKRVTLLRMTGANDWQPGLDMVGFLPPEADVKLERLPKGQLAIDVRTQAHQISLRADASVQICKTKENCFALTWTGGKLSGSAGWLGGKLLPLATGKAVTEVQVREAKLAVVSLLEAPESEGLTARQVASAVEQVPGAYLYNWDLGNGTRVFGLPTNTAGLMALVINQGKTFFTEEVSAGVVAQWIEAREVLTPADRWLLVLGRTDKSASLLVYRWTAAGWKPADPLAEKVDRMIGELTRITYTPGQTIPVRGIYVSGASDLKASFTPDGSGVAFCEAWRPCTTYQFDQRWVLK